MARIPSVLLEHLSPALQPAYKRAATAESGLAATLEALFVSPIMAERLVELDQTLRLGVGVESWIRVIVALTVAHERESRSLWDALEAQAAGEGVRDAVVQAIDNDSARKGLLPKESVWVQFAQEVLRGQTRDSTWAAVTHLVGDAGAVELAVLVCYYEMMARLTSCFGVGADRSDP